MKNYDIHTNGLLYTDNLLAEWSKRCDQELIFKILNDLKKLNYPRVKVDGYQSLWDITNFLDNPDTECSFGDKVKALYAFTSLDTAVLLDNERVIGDSNFISSLNQSGRIISKDLLDYLVDCGFKWSHNQNCVIK